MLVYVLGLFPFLPHVYHVAPDGEEPDGAPGDDPADKKGQYSCHTERSSLLPT